VSLERKSVENGSSVHDFDVGHCLGASAMNEVDVGTVYRCEEGGRGGGPEGYDV